MKSHVTFCPGCSSWCSGGQCCCYPCHGYDHLNSFMGTEANWLLHIFLIKSTRGPVSWSSARLLIVMSCWLVFWAALLNFFERIVIHSFTYSANSWAVGDGGCCFPSPAPGFGNTTVTITEEQPPSYRASLLVVGRRVAGTVSPGQVCIVCL